MFRAHVFIIPVATVCNVLIACSHPSGAPPTNQSGIQGAAGSSISTPVQFSQFKTRYARLSGSHHKAIPTSGNAQFQGLGQVVIRDKKNLASHTILKGTGTLKVRVDFNPPKNNKAAENSSVTGSITNITGYHGSDAAQQEASKAQRKKINGSLDFTSGVLRKDDLLENFISQFVTNYQGTLTVDNSSYKITGHTRHTENTKLIGTVNDENNKPSAIKGLQIIDTDGTATRTLSIAENEQITQAHGVSIEGYADLIPE